MGPDWFSYDNAEKPAFFIAIWEAKVILRPASIRKMKGGGGFGIAGDRERAGVPEPFLVE